MTLLSDLKTRLSNRLKQDGFANGTDCWIWQGTKNNHGYGVITGHKIKFATHRIAYCLYNNVNMYDIAHLVIMHSCDNRLCVNPEHLTAGSPQENSADMVKKKRSMFGEKNTRAKLKESQIIEIRELLKQGLPQRKIAALFGVSQRTVLFIKQGQHWKHIS